MSTLPSRCDQNHETYFWLTKICSHTFTGQLVIAADGNRVTFRIIFKFGVYLVFILLWPSELSNCLDLIDFEVICLGQREISSLTGAIACHLSMFLLLNLRTDAMTRRRCCQRYFDARRAAFMIRYFGPLVWTRSVLTIQDRYILPLHVKILSEEKKKMIRYFGGRRAAILLLYFLLKFSIAIRSNFC